MRRPSTKNRPAGCEVVPFFLLRPQALLEELAEEQSVSEAPAERRVRAQEQPVSAVQRVSEEPAERLVPVLVRQLAEVPPPLAL